MTRRKHSRPARDIAPVHPHAAAVDIGATLHGAAVRPGCDPEPVRTFGTFTTLPPIIFPGRPEGRRSDEALKAEPDAPQATLEQRHQAAGDVLALRRRGFFRRGFCFRWRPTVRLKLP